MRLATFVDEKMRAASESTPSGDSLRLAVLAALNIADELFRCRDATDQRNGQLAERTEELERMLDRVLMAVTVQGFPGPRFGSLTQNREPGTLNPEP